MQLQLLYAYIQYIQYIQYILKALSYPSSCVDVSSLVQQRLDHFR